MALLKYRGQFISYSTLTFKVMCPTFYLYIFMHICLDDSLSPLTQFDFSCHVLPSQPQSDQSLLLKELKLHLIPSMNNDLLSDCHHLNEILPSNGNILTLPIHTYLLLVRILYRLAVVENNNKHLSSTVFILL